MSWGTFPYFPRERECPVTGNQIVSMLLFKVGSVNWYDFTWKRVRYPGSVLDQPPQHYRIRICVIHVPIK